MNKILLTIALLATLPLAVFADDAYRQFKSTGGKIIEARILSGNDKMIKLQRKDGRKFEVKVLMFSEEDRDYIKEWVSENALNNIKLEITATSSRGNATNKSSGATKIKVYPAFYKVRITNKGIDTVEDLTVKYIFYKSTEKIASTSSNDKSKKQASGHRLTQYGGTPADSSSEA